MRGQEKLKRFKIPLFWQEYGYVCVEAASEEAAIEYALGPECPLPKGYYLDESIQLDREGITMVQDDGTLHVPEDLVAGNEPRDCMVLEHLVIRKTDIQKTERVLIDNGIAADEAAVVLQAIGYTLLGNELYKG